VGNKKQLYFKLFLAPNPMKKFLLQTCIFPTGGVLSKKFELISPKICRAGGIPPRPPFHPPAEATLSDWTISSFSFRLYRTLGFAQFGGKFFLFKNFLKNYF
jgi:hypothetical protein